MYTERNSQDDSLSAAAADLDGLDFESISPDDATIAAADAHISLNEKYAPTHLNTILEKSFLPKPPFFESYSAFIFQALTDGPSPYPNIPALQDFDCQTDFETLRNKIWLFPIIQVGKFDQPGLIGSIANYLSNNKPRDHWVTLHYDPKSGVGTLIDSRASLFSTGYNYTTLIESFNTAFSKLRLKINTLNRIYQSVQNDYHNCGPWTAINIETLAIGYPLEYIRTIFKKQQIPEIREHFSLIMSGEKKSSFYPFPQNLYGIEHGFDFPRLDLSALKTSFEEIVTQQNYQTIAKLINQRECLRKNSAALKPSNPLKSSEVPDVLSDFEKAYQGIKLTELCADTQRHVLTTYTLNDPGRLLGMLKINLKFTDDVLNQIPIQQALVYELGLYYVIAEGDALYEKISGKILFPLHINMNGEGNDPHSEVQTKLITQKFNFIEQLNLLLKEVIVAHLEQTKVCDAHIPSDEPKANSLSPEQAADNPHNEDVLPDAKNETRPQETSYLSEFFNLISAFFINLAQFFIAISNAIVEFFCGDSEAQTKAPSP